MTPTCLKKSQIHWQYHELEKCQENRRFPTKMLLTPLLILSISYGYGRIQQFFLHKKHLLQFLNFQIFKFYQLSISHYTKYSKYIKSRRGTDRIVHEDSLDIDPYDFVTCNKKCEDSNEPV